MEKQLLDLPETAGVLGLGVTKVRELVERGDLVRVRIDRAVRITRASINAYLDKLAEPGGGAMMARARRKLAPRNAS